VLLESDVVSCLYISVAAGLNVAITSYWLCLLYEIAFSAFPLALRLSRKRCVSNWVFAALTAQLVGALSIALVASYLVVALSNLPAFSEEHLPAWPLCSAALGVFGTGLALRFLPNFREELDAGAVHRIHPFFKLSKEILARELDS
jgi:tellurite resistance protein TehA-like permease